MRKQVLLLLGLGAAIGVALLALFLAAGRPARSAAPCTRYVVAPAGQDSGDCSDENHPCLTVQYALGWAADGETVCVADDLNAAGPSVYPGTVIITRSIVLDGAWNATCTVAAPFCTFTPNGCLPQNVVLDGLWEGRVISISGSIAPTIHCFTITRGDAAGLWGDTEGDAGGGIYSRDAAPIVSQNVISGNYGCDNCPHAYGRGGGVYLGNAPATAVISDNVIVQNVADNSTWGEGGGIFLRNSDAQVRGNVVQSNRAGLSAGYGGGIAAVDSGAVIADNQVLDNVAGQAVQGLGGGIFVWFLDADSTVTVTVERNLVQDNVALTGSGDPRLVTRGGGIYFGSDSPAATLLLRDNTVRDNQAAPADRGLGGGIFLGSAGSGVVVSGNTVNGNHAGFDVSYGGGLYLDQCQATVTENRISGNTGAVGEESGFGGGVYVNGGAGLVASNVITQNHAAGLGAGYGGGVAISNSLVLLQGNWIAENRSIQPKGDTGAGGGVYALFGAPAIVGNDILTNTTGAGAQGYGGGIYVQLCRPTISGNTVLDNTAMAGMTGRGGGVRITQCSTFTMTNNIVARNEASDWGSGVAIAASAGRVDFNTIVANEGVDGEGVQVGLPGYGASTVELINNIITNQAVGISNTQPLSNTVSASYTLFEGNGLDYGAGVSSASEVAGPAALQADYHLQSGSGAIDHAIPLSWVSDDIDGDSRPMGPAPDVGADEFLFLSRIYLPMVWRASP